MDNPPTGLEGPRLANYLADRLQDQHSLPFYRMVVKTAPLSAIRDALVSALDLPRTGIRRSRAAYFTSIIRPYLTAAPAARNAATV